MVDLAEWFVASVALLLVVTLIYIFVLNKSPPPEGITQSRTESSSVLGDPAPIISAAQDALRNGDDGKAADYL